MKKSGSKRIAERYVKALFDMAKSASALETIEQDLASLAKALEQNKDFSHFLNNPLVPSDHQADAMVAILAKMQAHAITRQFVAMLTSKKRLPLLPDIIALFMVWAQADRGELKAELISATALNSKEIETISQRLSKAYGKKINLDVRQDPALLGGIVIRIGSQQLDSSLAGKMRRLKNTLKAA